jgi:hypothetical protein
MVRSYLKAILSLMPIVLAVFDESIPGKVEYIKDNTLGMIRTKFFVLTAAVT